MQSLKRLSAMLLAVTVVGCEAGLLENNTNPPPTPTSAATAPPAMLRIVPNEELTARVTVNSGLEESYFGSNFSDGNWQIPVRLISGETNQIFIRWMVGDLLLLEEFGEIVWNATDTVIRPDFSFTTAGAERFDADCDGASNLAEIYANSDPLVPDGSSSACQQNDPPLEIDITAGTIAALAVNTARFVNEGFTDRVTNFEIPVNVKSFRSTGRARFVAKLVNFAPGNPAVQLYIAIENDAASGPFVSLYTQSAGAANQSAAAQSSCEKLG